MAITIYLHRNPRKWMGFCYTGHLCKVLYESIFLALYNILWQIGELLWSYVYFKATHILADIFFPFCFCLGHLSLFNAIVFSAAWRITPFLRHTPPPRAPGCSVFLVPLYLLLLKMVGRTNYLQMLLLGFPWLCSSLFFFFFFLIG